MAAPKSVEAQKVEISPRASVKVVPKVADGLYDNWAKWEGIAGKVQAVNRFKVKPSPRETGPSSADFFRKLCEYLKSDQPLTDGWVDPQIEKEFVDMGRDLRKEIYDLRRSLREREEIAALIREKEAERDATKPLVSAARAEELLQLMQALQEMNTQLAEQFRCLQEANDRVSKVLLSVLEDLRKVAGVPPVGEVTLAFTDVQGSTSQWEMHPKVMEKALALHNEVIRKAIDSMEGYEVKTEGDAFMVAFQSPILALKWALAVQENLLGADWEEGVMMHPDAEEESDPDDRILWRGLRVRIGLHSGSPRCTPDVITGRMDYFGNMVNKSARVEGGTHGGQVVISGEMYEAVKPHLDQIGNVIVKNLGKYPLRGIEGDTELIQVLTPFLSMRAFPPPFKKYFPAPTGEITLCFTDVQGSTTQWEMHAPIMAKALAIHNQIMRRRMKEFNGYEVRTEGDAFMVAFEQATDAVNWALTSQVDLAHADWPEELYRHPDSSLENDEKGGIKFRGYRVRVGINTGTPKCEVDPTTGRMSYHGKMVIRAGGVEGLTNGGQINLSSSTWEAVSPFLKKLRSHRVKELGDFKLRGAESEEMIRQILPASLAARSWPLPGSEQLSPIEKIKPPMGEMTLCNTDVQGSTTQWEMHPDVMQAGLEMHNNLMRELIVKFGGYEVRTEGDAFFVAFAEAKDAVNWAITAQQELMKLKWPEQLFDHKDSAIEKDQSQQVCFRGMRVRIGIHTASPLAEEDPRTGRMDYFGPVTTHAHLVENAAHGGQIVIGDSTWEACQRGKLLLPHTSTSMGRFMFAREEGIELFQILPENLKTRTFKAPPILHLRAAPRGEVTIVYTDVKGSTTQWEMHPEVMEAGLNIHNDIMRRRIQEYNGYEVKTEGDAFMVSFGTPWEAVQWGLSIQVDLLRADWPEALFKHPDSAVQYSGDQKTVVYRGMRVRVGMHTGSPKCDPDPITSRMDYFGATVNRAASMEGAAQGGQILVSGDTWDRLSNHLDKLTSHEIKELGEYKLSGQKEKERLFQILPSLLSKREFAPPLSTPPEVQSLTDLSGKLGGLQEQNEKLQKELSTLEESLAESSSRLADVRSQVMSDKAGSMSAVLLEISEILQHQSDIQDNIQDAGQQQRQVAGTMDKVNRVLGSMSSKVEDSFSAKSRIEEESILWNKKFEALKAQEEKTKERCDELEKKWNAFLQSGSNAAELKHKVERLEALEKEENDKLEKLKEKLKEAEEEAQAQKDHERHFADTTQKTQSKHEELKEKEGQLQKELQDIISELKEVESKIAELEKKKNDLEEEARQSVAVKRKKLHFQAKLSILTDEVEELENALEKRKEGVPDAVNNFHIKKATSETASVHWKPPASKTKIACYAIYIRILGEDSFQLYDYSSNSIVAIGEGKSIPGTETNLTMAGLVPNTNYELKMRACNDEGWGVRSTKSVKFTTLSVEEDDAHKKKKRSPSLK